MAPSLIKERQRGRSRHVVKPDAESAIQYAIASGGYGGIHDRLPFYSEHPALPHNRDAISFASRCSSGIS